MSTMELFPQRQAVKPLTIYAYELPEVPARKGYLKIGHTKKYVPDRVKGQLSEARLNPKIVNLGAAIKNDGTVFTDHLVHAVLKARGFKQTGGSRSEWFKCSIDDVKAALVAIKTGTANEEDRTLDFKMRPEQQQAVDKTVNYFNSIRTENKGRTPKFLWNAKMRFGKTFAAYQLAKQMKLKRILILTFKPAVRSAWREDLLRHIDFEGWQFISRATSLNKLDENEQYDRADKSKPIVCFGSFQDFLGVNENGGIKAKNEWVHTTNWDLVIFDEYHFGAWKDTAKALFELDEDSYDEDLSKYDAGNAYDETWLPITANYYLYLSGTPFRALNSGEFIEEQVYNWTYSDEQQAKESWTGVDNPYAALPRLVMLTYRVPDSIQEIAKKGEFDEFDLNVFFSATGSKEKSRFVYEDYVQKWLDLIRGAYSATTVDELKLGAKKPVMPYADVRLLDVLTHTLWFLPNVASCYAMANLLGKRQNIFFHDYKINICAGPQAGIGENALIPVLDSMEEPLKSKTITLSCGKLTTGVTIKPWTGILMLRNLSSPETYFQAAFRVQSPWEITTDTGEKEIIKRECYVFDFALDRALRQISDYSCQLNVEERNPERKVEDFIKFLPVLAFDGSSMKQVDAKEILDIAMAGTSATLLARRWESALLVNVDNDTLKRLLASEKAMEVLMRIEGFRNLNKDIATIINLSERVKRTKKDNKSLTPEEKKELSAEEKEFKTKRKLIQEKLIKFATRVPVFMYLTDYREHCLRDVITQLEPDLFKKVTGLQVEDFELLVSLNVFNESLMNDAVYKFRRYEDASLVYTGVDKHIGEQVGLYSTVISREDYDLMAGQVAASMQVTKNLNDKNGHSTSNQGKDQKRVADSSSRIKTEQAVGSTYRPSYVPPTTTIKPLRKKIIKVDTSKIKVGTVVTHKAFGIGKVKGIHGDFIEVTFENQNKRFLYPSAFEQGFLTLADETVN